MNKKKVVESLVFTMKTLRNSGNSDPEIKKLLVEQGCAIGAVQEALGKLEGQ